VTRLGVRVVTLWEIAWVWLAASYAFGSGWGLIGDLGADSWVWEFWRGRGRERGWENCTDHPVVHLLLDLQLSRLPFQKCQLSFDETCVVCRSDFVRASHHMQYLHCLCFAIVHVVVGSGAALRPPPPPLLPTLLLLLPPEMTVSHLD
jgi:hypothetical protein